MKATQASLQDTFNSPNQYVVPVFQRYYTWKKDNWDELWESISELYSANDSDKRLFMGALVFVSRPVLTIDNPTYEVIDGQQRLTTFAILFCAIRNLARTKGTDEADDFAKEIEKTVLVHEFRKGSARLRVLPRHRDFNDFCLAVEGSEMPQGRIRKALLYFEETISEFTKNEMHKLKTLFRLLAANVDFVHIILSGENPYKIFRSLNSTGVDLSESDLIRNFMFMKIPTDGQSAFDEQHWQRLEALFPGKKDNVDGKELSSFLRDYLMSDGTHIGNNATFQEFERRFAGKSVKAQRLVTQLINDANLYQWINGNAPHTSKTVNSALAKLRHLKSSTASPLALVLLRACEAGTMDPKELIECLELLSGFIYRRYICGLSSRNYSEWFVAACKLRGGVSAERLREFLESKGFPGAKQFRDHLPSFPLYESKYALYTLAFLERSFKSKESPLPEDFPFSLETLRTKVEIEHVLPQKMTAVWRAMLGENAAELHEQYADTLGNLTLTGYNQGLSNHDFDTKLNGLKNTSGYLKSGYELTESIARNKVWTADEIEERALALAERAVKVWTGPTVGMDVEDEDEANTSFRKGSEGGVLFAILSDGQWHDLDELAAFVEDEARLDQLLRRIERRGVKTGSWVLEKEESRVRVVQAEQGKAAGA